MSECSEYLIMLHGECYTLVKKDIQRYFETKGFSLQRNMATAGGVTSEMLMSPLARRYMPVEVKLKRDNTNQCVIMQKFDTKLLVAPNEKDYHRKVVLMNWSPTSNDRLMQVLSKLQIPGCFDGGEVVARVTQSYKPDTKLQLKSKFPDITICSNDKELFALFDELFGL